jgi:hypothetical protein
MSTPLALSPSVHHRHLLSKIYKARGAADRLHLVVGPGGHRFYADAAWPVMLREIGGLSR